MYLGITLNLFIFQDYCGIVAQAQVTDKTEQLRRTFVVLVFKNLRINNILACDKEMYLH